MSLKIKLTTIFWRFFLYPSRFSVRLPCKKAPTSTETTTSKPSHKPCWSFSDLPPVRLGKKSCCLAKKTHQLFVMTYRTMPVARTGVVLTSHIPISSPFSWYVSIDYFNGLLFLKFELSQLSATMISWVCCLLTDKMLPDKWKLRIWE